MTETLQTTYAEITTDCICEIYIESNGESMPSETCYGCYDESITDLHDNILSPWLNAIGAEWDSNIRIECSSMGWQGRAGATTVPARKIDEALAINGDYRLNFALEGNRLCAIRYSHDEPTGTGTFRFWLAPDDAE